MRRRALQRPRAHDGRPVSSTWRVALVGGLLGLLAVAGVVTLAMSGVLGTGAQRAQASADAPVLVALVLPDAAGANLPRVIDLYTRANGKLTLTSVDPEHAATVPGTSGKTLADAYTYGGGAALAKAYAQLNHTDEPAWVVIGQDAWGALRGGAPVTIDIPAPMEVFDGRQLYSYSKGTTDVPVAQVRHVLDGADFLSRDLRRSVRAQLGDGLATSLARTKTAHGVELRTNLSDEDLTAWLAILGPAVRTQGE